MSAKTQQSKTDITMTSSVICPTVPHYMTCWLNTLYQGALHLLESGGGSVEHGVGDVGGWGADTNSTESGGKMLSDVVSSERVFTSKVFYVLFPSL